MADVQVRARRASIDAINNLSLSGVTLKPVADVMVDKSAPIIDSQVKLATVDRSAHLQAIQGGVGRLRSVSQEDASLISDRSAPKIDSSVKVAKSPHADVLSQVRVAGSRRATLDAIKHDFDENVSLKPVENVSDKSAPVIDPEVKVGRVDRAAHLEAIHSGPRLRSVSQEEALLGDRSAPLIDASVKLARSPMADMLTQVRFAGSRRATLETIKHDFQGVSLKPVEHASDKSAPVIDPEVRVAKVDRHAHLAAIEGGAAVLSPAPACHDRSSPQIEASVAVKPTNRPDLLSEVRAKGSRRATLDAIKHNFSDINLKPAENVADKSAPQVEAVEIRKVDRSVHLEAIQGASPTALRPAGQVNDRSSPVIDTSVEVKATAVPALLSEVRLEGSRRASINTIKHAGDNLSSAVQLKPVADRMVDKSGPAIDDDIQIKKIDRKGHLEAIQNSPQLKPTPETKDRSQPMIESEVQVQSSNRPQFLEQVRDAAVRRLSVA